MPLKKKYIFIIITVFCVLLISGIAGRHETLQAEGIGVVSVKGYLNVRTGPAEGYSYRKKWKLVSYKICTKQQEFEWLCQ